jgi:hypothetical protein
MLNESDVNLQLKCRDMFKGGKERRFHMFCTHIITKTVEAEILCATKRSAHASRIAF